MLKLGFCITGSFCSMNDMLEVLKKINKEYDVEVFVTPHVHLMDTRFYSALELESKIREIVDKDIHYTIQEAEVYGPKKNLDIVLIYPCDATTLTKIDTGINDNVVTMLVKSSLRNQVPIVIGLYSNDVLSHSGIHLMHLMGRKHFYFVPMYQDDYQKKPYSMIADYHYVLPTLKKAIDDKQLQPFMLGYKEIDKS